MLKNGFVYPGSLFRVTINFVDEDGAAVDPDAVTLKTISPMGTETEYTYGSGDTIQQAETGSYYGDLRPDQAGRWQFRWEATTDDEVVAVTEDSFVVQKSNFAPYNTLGRPDYA